MKIQELAAMIGGFMKIILFIAETFVSPYSRFLLNQKLMDLIISDEESTELLTDINIRNPVKHIDSQNSMSIQKVEQSSAQLNNYMHMYSKLHSREVNPLSFWNYALEKYSCLKNQRLH